MKKFYPFIILILLTACGESVDDNFLNTDSPQPVIIAAIPSSAKPGDTVQIQGVGFTPTVNLNIILVAGTSSTATDFSLIANPSAAGGATDQITFVLPNEAQIGATNLQVFVGQNPSNAIAFTVESP